MQYTKIKGKYYKLEKEISKTEKVKELENQIGNLDGELEFEINRLTEGYTRKKEALQEQLEELNKLN